MTAADIRGLALSTPGEDANDAFERALASHVGSHGDPLAEIERGLARHGGFAMGHALRAALLVVGWDEPRPRDLAEAIAGIDALGTSATRRERAHANAARAWLAGAQGRSAAIYGSIVDEYPRDLVALFVAQTLDFHAGRRARMQGRVARALRYWRADLPGYAAVRAMHAFALEENGDYARAEAEARVALTVEPGLPAAVHAVAHVMEMQGRAREGVAWLAATEDAWGASSYAVHHAWHLALFHLDCDHVAEARAILETRVDTDDAPPMSALVDAASLLWRLSLRGADAGVRWQHLAARWDDRPLEGTRAFNLVHAMLAFVSAGHRDGTRRVRLALERQATARETREDARLALPLCAAFEHFGAGAYALAVRRLTEVRHLAARCGGSVAQCDLIQLTLIEAALRGRHANLAGELAAERAARRPGGFFNRWLAARARLAVAGA